MAAVETISRDDFKRQVDRGDVTVFRYTPNSRGFIFLQVCSALLFVISFAVYLATSFDPRYWAVLSIFLCTVGLGLLYLVVRWTHFAKNSAIAFDDDYLYVVTAKKVERIHWEQVSAESAGFSDPADDGDHGTLNMDIDGQEVAVRLFNPFVWVDDFPTFLVELLSQIKRNRDLASGEADAVEEVTEGIEPTEEDAIFSGGLGDEPRDEIDDTEDLEKPVKSATDPDDGAEFDVESTATEKSSS